MVRKSLSEIQVQHVLYSGKWLAAFYIWLVFRGSGISEGPGFATVITLLGGGAAAAAFSSRQRETKASWWLVWVALDIVAAGFLFGLLRQESPAIWLFCLWCAVEAALTLRSLYSLAAVAILDGLSAAIILPWPGGLYTWLGDAVFFSFLSLAAISLVYTQRHRRIELEQQVEKLSRQIEKIHELEHINRQMTDYTMDVQNRAVIDQLTGLVNQTHFHHRLLIEVEKARQSRTPLSLVLCDIDHFKRFNDQFGHYLGDDVLRSVARVILDAVEGTFWVAGRIGGEEMAILMPDVPLRKAESFAEDLRSLIADTVVPGPAGPLHITVSCGVATFPDTADDAMQLTKQADKAMYTAKDSGRNRVMVRRA